MSFCKYSSEKTIIDSVKISNVFITEYMPMSPEGAVKTYLLGLFFCNNYAHPNNTLTYFSSVLGIQEEDVLANFMYLQDLGLVKVLNIEPIEIRFLPVKKPTTTKNVNKGKYSEFCYCVQELIPNRMISPNEFYEYINFLDSMHMQPDALLQVIKFCANIKGGDVGYAYILTVAKAWAYKGLLSLEAVEQEIQNNMKDDENLKELLRIFGIRRIAAFEEREIWANIKNELNFELSTIFYVAKSLKSKNKSGLSQLQNKLQKYYSMELKSIEDIEQFEQQKSQYYTMAKNITSKLGVYYENLEPVIETYINKWTNWGYSEQILNDIASFCFKSSIRTLEGMDNKLTKFYKLGIITSESLSEYISDLVNIDNNIKQILEKLGTTRNVNNFDRDIYKTWIQRFNISSDLLEYAITKAIGKVQPMQYLNKIICYYYDNGIKTVEQAKEDKKDFVAPTANKVSTHSYSTQDINSLFKTIDEIEV